MNIGFFGGTGFFGSAILRCLKQNKIEEKNIYFIARSKRSNFTENFILSDATDKNNLPENHKFDVVIHGISDSTNTIYTSDYVKIEKAIQSTINIAHYCKRTKVKKIVYLSSGAVYGNYNIARHESFKTKINALDHKDHYAMGKICSETFLKSYCSQNSIKLSIVRPFAFGGKDIPKNVHYVIGNLVNDVLSGKDLIITGNGRDVRTYMHQDDMVKLLFRIIDDERNFTLHNLGSEEIINIKKLANKIIEISGKKLSIKIKGNYQNPFSIYIPDCTRIKVDYKIDKMKTINHIIRDMLD